MSITCRKAAKVINLGRSSGGKHVKASDNRTKSFVMGLGVMTFNYVGICNDNPLTNDSIVLEDDDHNSLVGNDI